MNLKLIRQAAVVAAAGLVASALSAAAATAVARHGQRRGVDQRHVAAPTTTPIKHVVVIIGENHSFDNVFATYQPPGHQHIWNLLSEGIVTKNGSPGPNFAAASQLTASDTKKYTLTPTITGAYTTLPQPNTTYVCQGLRRPARQQRGHPVPGQPAQRAVPDHQVRAVLRQPPGVLELGPVRAVRRLRRRPDPPLLPDVAAERGLPRPARHLGDQHGRGRQRREPAGPDLPGRRADGLLQHGQGDAPILRDLAAALRDQRQLPPGRAGRHRRQPHRARHRVRRVVPELLGPGGPAAVRRDREPQPEARDQQQLHPGRLRQQHHGQHRRQLLRVRGPVAAGRRRRSSATWTRCPTRCCTTASPAGTTC